MNTKLIRAVALCMILMLCIPLTACDKLMSEGILGSLLEYISSDVGNEQLPEDISQALGSVSDDFFIPTQESVQTDAPLPDTDVENTTVEETMTDAPITETEEIVPGEEYTFTEGLEYLSHGNGTCSVIGMGTCTDTEIVIPAHTSNGDAVVCIEGSAFAFENSYTLTSVVIPDTVTRIEYYAFFGCSGLTEITIPDSVTSINGSFVGCTGLTSVVLPKSLESITGEAFACCSNLSSIAVAEGNTTYHSVDNCVIETATNALIMGCKDSVVPDYITSIAGRAFYNCFELKNVKIPDGVTSIGECAFIGCSELASMEIPNSVTYIGDSAFHGCTGIIRSENGLSYVDDWVVGYEGNVTSVDLSGAKGMAGAVFQGRSDLESVILPDSLTYLSSFAFQDCTGLTGITLPGNLKSMDVFAFQGCTGLTSITIPDSMENIESFAFQNCTGLNSVTILSNKTVFGGLVFHNCSAVTDVFYAGSEQDWETCGCAGEFENATIHYNYVPES